MCKNKLISIDSSTKKTGLSIFEDNKFKDVFLIDIHKIKDMDSRFKEMSIQIYNFLEKEKPQKIYLEETVVLNNASTQRFLTRLQGVIYCYCMFNNCEFNTIRPTEWRKLVGIKQGKDKNGKKIKKEDLKREAIEMVKEKYDLELNDDMAESILIGEAAFMKEENEQEEIIELKKRA